MISVSGAMRRMAWLQEVDDYSQMCPRRSRVIHTGDNPADSFSPFLGGTPYNIAHGELLVELIPGFGRSCQDVEMLDPVVLFVHIMATLPDFWVRAESVGSPEPFESKFKELKALFGFST
jgi:hypothetical protein